MWTRTGNVVNKKIIYFFPFFILLFITPAAFADVSIETSVSNAHVQVGEELTLDIVISNANGAIQKPVFPPLDGFTAYSQGHAQEISIINGRSTSRSVFTYVLIPNSAGRKAIGPFEIPIGGKIFKAPAIDIDVLPATTPLSGGGGSSVTSGPVSSPPTRALPSGNVSNQDIFVKVWLDKDEVYVNEPATMTFTLYTRLSATYKGFDKEPVTTGFWIEDFPPEKTISKTEQILDGSRYVVADVRKIVLFPTESGAFTIDPGVLSATVEVRNQDFDSFFSYNIFGRRSLPPLGFTTQVVAKTIPTIPVSIVVKQLPAEGKPADFNGAVGNYRIESSIDKGEVEQGEPVTYRVKITGVGNINTLTPPAFPKLDDFKIYDSSSSTQLSKERLMVEGEKVTETVLVPKKSGTFTIPPLLFSYFDVKTGSYHSLKTFSHSLKVDPSAEPVAADESVSSGVQPASKEDVSFLARDIRFLKKIDSSEVAVEKALYQMPFYWFLNLALLLLWLGLGILSSRAQSGQGLRAFAFRRAHRVARAKLRATKHKLKKEKPEEFYTELSKAIHEYFSGKFEIPIYMVSIASIEEKTSGLEADPVLLNETKELFRTLDQVRFAKTGEELDKMKEIYDRADRVITNFERLKIK